MVISDATVTAAFGSLFAMLVSVVLYVRNQMKASNEECAAENAWLREVIVAIYDGDRERATAMVEAMRPKTGPHPVPKAKRGPTLWGFMPFCFLGLALLLVTACGSTDPQPVRGTAQATAASESARVESLAHDADAAALDAAAKAGRAKALEEAARKFPTPARIEQAVEAGVAASIAQAIADAQAASLSKARTAAEEARIKANKERADEAIATDTRHWVWICRLVGLAGLVAGGLIGGLMAWATKSLAPGAYIGSGLAVLGLLVVAFGQTITWLPLAMGAAVIAALILWAWRHAGASGLAVSLSRVVDAVEGNAVVAVDKAKEALPIALARSGMGKRLQRLRRAWKRAESTAHAIVTKPTTAASDT